MVSKTNVEILIVIFVGVLVLAGLIAPILPDLGTNLQVIMGSIPCAVIDCRPPRPPPPCRGAGCEKPPSQSKEPPEREPQGQPSTPCSCNLAIGICTAGCQNRGSTCTSNNNCIGSQTTTTTRTPVCACILNRCSQECVNAGRYCAIADNCIARTTTTTTQTTTSSSTTTTTTPSCSCNLTTRQCTAACINRGSQCSSNQDCIWSGEKTYFTSSNFVCNPSGTDYNCKFDYRTNFPENVLVMFTLTNSTGVLLPGGVSTSVLTAKTGATPSGIFHCSSVSRGLYNVTWYAFNASDTLHITPLNASVFSDKQYVTVTCA